MHHGRCMINFSKNETNITIETKLRERNFTSQHVSVESCCTNDLINYGVVSLEVSSRYSSSIASRQRRNKNFRFDRRDSRLSEVSNDRGNEVRRARDYVTYGVLAYRLLSCFAAGKGASWSPTTSPTSVKTHQISLCISSIKIHETIFVHHARNTMYYRERPKTIRCLFTRIFFKIRIRFVFLAKKFVTTIFSVIRIF